jgi:predicted kinase
MGKHLKLGLFGAPGSGKSTLASQFPNRFFICTDGNYEWLPNAKEEDHVQISSWKEFKDIVLKKDFSKYDCIVVDLLEDLYDWCVLETCKSAGVTHVSELGDYGKGYDIVYTNFNAEMSKFLAKDISIILITHESVYQRKDEFGITYDYFEYSNHLKERVMTPIEGKLRAMLHVYKTTVIDPTTKRRKNEHLISFIPSANEYGINRGTYDENTPQTIPCGMKTLLTLIGYYDDNKDVPTEPSLGVLKNAEPKQEEKHKEELVKEESSKKVQETKQSVNELQDIFSKFKSNQNEAEEQKTEPQQQESAEHLEQEQAAQPEQIPQPVKLSLQDILNKVRNANKE